MHLDMIVTLDDLDHGLKKKTQSKVYLFLPLNHMSCLCCVLLSVSTFASSNAVF